MGLFSKLFGASEPKTQKLIIPDEASSRDVIGIAITSILKQAGGNCATLESITDPEKWVQIMDSSVNCHYPHQEDPEHLFPEMLNHSVIAALEGYEPGLYMTVSMSDMNDPEITGWIEQYFSQVLSTDIQSSRLNLRMEDI